MCLWVSFKKKYEKVIFLHPWSHWRKESDPVLDPDLEPDPLVRVTDLDLDPHQNVTDPQRPNADIK